MFSIYFIPTHIHVVEIMSEKEFSTTIYLVNIPLKPRDKVEIQQLQSALMIATLSIPQIFEYLEDPVERVLFADELFVAAAALAREKAGYSISQIAEELGRNEVTIKAHLEGATRVGRIVREVYESLSKSEKKELVVRRVNIVVANEEVAKKFMEMIKRLEDENSELRETIKKLEKELSTCKLTIEEILGVLKEKISEILREKISELLKS